MSFHYALNFNAAIELIEFSNRKADLEIKNDFCKHQKQTEA